MVIKATASREEAMDIFASCFVFASAGSGKTKVLVDRFVKHLINGYRPRDIMCVTFTRAAIFEMASRLGSLLQELESAPEERLKEYLQEALGIQAPSDKQLTRAQSLYSLWIEDYSNLNIVTIHSFCQKLLEEYPIESGVHPEFTVLDELEADCLLGEAKTTFFRDIRNSA